MVTVVESAPALAGDESAVELTVPLFFGMIEAGLIAPERRLFLWDGRLFEKPAKTTAHATTAVRFHGALGSRLPDGWVLWPENPIALDERHAPLPDLTVVRGPLARYEDEARHPRVADVGLVIEIAVSSLPRDLNARAEKFARALVPAYWVADVRGRRMVAHEAPRVVAGAGTYEDVRHVGHGEEIRLMLDGREVARIPVAELLR